MAGVEQNHSERQRLSGVFPSEENIDFFLNLNLEEWIKKTIAGIGFGIFFKYNIIIIINIARPRVRRQQVSCKHFRRFSKRFYTVVVCTDKYIGNIYGFNFEIMNFFFSEPSAILYRPRPPALLNYITVYIILKSKMLRFCIMTGFPRVTLLKHRDVQY